MVAGRHNMEAPEARRLATRVRESRRLALLKRAGMFGNVDNATIGRANTYDDLAGAYHLVHDMFVFQGILQPNDTRMRIRPWEAQPETATVIAKSQNQVVGVTSVVFDSPDMGLPTDQAFGAEVDVLRSMGRRICEGTNWAIAHGNTSVMTELMRCSLAHAMARGCDDFLGTVSPGHMAFYKLLGFEQIGSIRSYDPDQYDPVVLVRLNVADFGRRFANVNATDGDDEAFLKSYYLVNNPYHRYVQAWQILTGRFFADATLVRELFVNRGYLPERCTPAQLDGIRRRWGDEIFEQVAGAQSPVVTNRSAVAEGVR